MYPIPNLRIVESTIAILSNTYALKYIFKTIFERYLLSNSYQNNNFIQTYLCKENLCLGRFIFTTSFLRTMFVYNNYILTDLLIQYLYSEDDDMQYIYAVRFFYSFYTKGVFCIQSLIPTTFFVNNGNAHDYLCKHRLS